MRRRGRDRTRRLWTGRPGSSHDRCGRTGHDPNVRSSGSTEAGFAGASRGFRTRSSWGPSSDRMPTIRSFFCRIRRHRKAETVLSLPQVDSRGRPTMHAGEQTLLVTRPTRLIALRFWSAMFLALILAGVFGFHVPRFFGSTVLNYTVAGIDFGLILAGFFLFLALLAFFAAELKRKTIRHLITDNKIIRD